MEQVLDGLSTALRAMLGLLIVIGPGLLFWLVVAGVAAGVRWVTHRNPIEGVQEGQAASSPSTVKS